MREADPGLGCEQLRVAGNRCLKSVPVDHILRSTHDDRLLTTSITMSQQPSRTRPVWPYLFALGVAAVLTFPTALVLGLAGLDGQAQILLSALAFAALSAGLAFYVRCCLAPSRRRGLDPVRGQT